MSSEPFSVLPLIIEALGIQPEYRMNPICPALNPKRSTLNPQPTPSPEKILDPKPHSALRDLLRTPFRNPYEEPSKPQRAEQQSSSVPRDMAAQHKGWSAVGLED